MSTVFSIQNLKLTYANKCILDDINLEISEGQMVTVIGENGSGKTTLLNTLVGLTPVQKGTVSLHGKPIQTYETHLLAQQISSLGQSDIRIDDMPVWSRISQGFIPNRGPAFVPGPKETAWIQNIAERLKIADCLDLTLGQLSGGERRRVHLARALVNPSPQIIILDEPFANIDIGHQTLITTILRERVQAGCTAICAVQQLHLVAELGGHVLGLKNGRKIIADPPEKALTEHNLERLFSRRARYYQSEDSFHGVLFKI